jgi:hypothetical protein
MEKRLILDDDFLESEKICFHDLLGTFVVVGVVVILGTVVLKNVVVLVLVLCASAGVAVVTTRRKRTYSLY